MEKTRVSFDYESTSNALNIKVDDTNYIFICEDADMSGRELFFVLDSIAYSMM